MDWNGDLEDFLLLVRRALRFVFRLGWRLGFIYFLIKLENNTKQVYLKSLPEDGLNTRNRAGNDSKQQAYTHATIYSTTN